MDKFIIRKHPATGCWTLVRKADGKVVSLHYTYYEACIAKDCAE
jgi:hypothetical protein